MHRFRIVTIVLGVLALAMGCDETHTPPVQTPTPEHVEISDIDFVRDTYFYLNHSSIAYTPRLLPDPTHAIDVYLEAKLSDVFKDPTLVTFPGRAFVDSAGTGEWIDSVLAPLASGEFPPDSLTLGPCRGSVPSVRALWMRLTPGDDYQVILDPVTFDIVGIELTRPIRDSENRALAVSYTTVDGRRVGGQRYNDLLPPNQQIDPDSLAMKLIKSRRVRPTGDYGYLWNYMLRNIYRIGLIDIDPDGFRLDIVDNIIPRDDPTTPDGVDVPYTRIFGLDRYTETGELGSDGMVDLRPGTVDLQRGLVMFPSLTPFAPTPAEVQSFTDGLFAFDDPAYNGKFVDQYLKAGVLYSEYVNNSDLPALHQYSIRVEGFVK